MAVGLVQPVLQHRSLYVTESGGHRLVHAYHKLGRFQDAFRGRDRPARGGQVWGEMFGHEYRSGFGQHSQTPHLICELPDIAWPPIEDEVFHRLFGESQPEAAPAATQSSSTEPVRVGGNIRPPRKVEDVNPIYPAVMREANLEGLVPLEAIIAADGTVASVRVLSAQVHSEFARAAEDAVGQWRFTPTLLNGAPVEVRMAVSVRFSLSD